MTTTRAAIYCRISSDRENTRLGVERQAEDCRLLCEEKQWSVAGVYVDNDITAADPKKTRPEYERMMTDVAAGKIDAVVVYVGDRLHRQPIELEQFVGACKAVGMYKLASVKSGEVDLSDANALMVLRIQTSVAQNEVDRTSYRIRRKMLELAQAGKDSGGGRAFGFERDRVTVRESEAELMREAAKRVLEGESLYSIRNDWTRREIPTVTGKPWSTQMLKSMLLRPRATGLRQHQGEVIGEAQWPAILDRSTWEQVRTILNNPARRQPPPSRDYPLSGVLFCGECGRKLSSMPRKGNRNYGCRKDGGGCGHTYIRSGLVEDYVFAKLLPMLDIPMFREELVKAETGSANQLQELVLERTKAEATLAELSDDYYQQKIIGRDVFLKQSAAAKQTIETVNQQISSIHSQSALGRIGKQKVATALQTMSAEDKRLLVLTLFTSIIINRPVVPNQFDARRIQPVWRFENLRKLVPPLGDETPAEQLERNAAYMSKPEQKQARAAKIARAAKG